MQFLAGLLVTFSTLVGTGCGPSCKDAVRNMARVTHAGDAVSEGEIDEGVAACERRNLPKQTLECIANAKTTIELNACGTFAGAPTSTDRRVACAPRAR